MFMKTFYYLVFIVLLVSLTSCASQAPPPEPETPAKPAAVEGSVEQSGFTVDPNIGRLVTYKFDEAEPSVILYRFISMSEGKDNVSSYILESPNNLVIIDTLERQSAAKELRRFVDYLNKPVERVIITHSHSPHYFGLNYFGDFDVYALPEVQKNIEIRSDAVIRWDYKKLGSENELPKSVPAPSLNLPSDFTVDGVEYKAMNFPNSENVEQTILLIPSVKAVITTDLLEKNAHLIVVDPDAFLKALSTISSFEAQGYVHLYPMRGEEFKYSEIKLVRDYIETVKEILRNKPTFVQYKKAIENAYPEYGSADFVSRLMRQYGVFQY